MGPTSEYLAQAQHHLRVSTAVEEKARAHLTDVQEARRFWEKLATQLGAVQPAAALMTLNTEGRRLQGQNGIGDEKSRLIDSMREEFEATSRENAREFGRMFPSAVRESGIEIDSTSRHPKYTVMQGFIEIDVDDRAFTATITPRDGNQLTIGLDVGPIVAWIEQEIARLFNRDYSPGWPNQFWKTLFNAYTAVVRSEGRNIGDDVPLRRVTNRLSKNLNRFSADEFNVDLARAMKSGLLEFENHKIEFQHTRHPRQGILLHGLEDGGYLGFISFKKDN